MTPADFPQLMADVKQFQSVLEQIFAAASNPMEKELLGAALKNIRKGVAEAETSVPQAFQMIEEHAKKAQEEGLALQEEFAKKRVELEALRAEEEQRQAELKAAQRPPLEEWFTPIEPMNGGDLRLDMLRSLGLGANGDEHGKDPLRKTHLYREIWEDWHWE